MDLERLGSHTLSEALLDDYEEFSGDVCARTLAYHYCASRAYVRAKVACLAHAEGVAGADEQARAFYELALSFLERARVRLIIIGGLPGTGKSTLAQALGDELGAVVLRSDEIRKEISQSLGDAPALPDRYSDEMTTTTYGTMLKRAQSGLERGQSVILDASWTNRKHRADRAASG